MPTISFRKRQRLANVPRHTLTQRVLSPFHMCRLSPFFADTSVRFDREHGGIRRPEIAETEAAPIRSRNPMPEPPTGAFAGVADDNGDDPACPTTPDRPEPAFPRPLADKRPNLIDFQAVVRLRRMQGRPERRQPPKFFLIRAARVLRETPDMRLIPRIPGRS